MIGLPDLAQPAIGHCGGEGRYDDAATEPAGELDRGPRERGDISGDRSLDWLRGDRDIVEPVMLAIVRNLSDRASLLAEFRYSDFNAGDFQNRFDLANFESTWRADRP